MKREDIYIQLVSDKTVLPIELIKSKSRKREVCEARQVCSFILVRHTKLKSFEIAKKLHYKSHTSVLRDKKQVSEFLLNNRKFSEKYLPIINDAMKIALRFLHNDNAKDEQISAQPGDICWFWNFWSRFPIIGTLSKSYTGSNNDHIYLCREYPSLSFTNCIYVDQEILPESFRKPVKEILQETEFKSTRESIPA